MPTVINPQNPLTTVVVTVTEPSQLTLFHEAESKRRRDEGMTQATSRSSEWQERAMWVIWKLPIGWTGIGEDIRKLVLESGAGPPHHHNCWGGLIMYAIRCKVIEKTGAMKSARIVTSHARNCVILERI